MSRHESCAVIGLGNMGIEVATRLAAAGRVVGFDLSPERRALAASRGLAVAATLKETTAGATTAVLSLPTPAASRATDQQHAVAPGHDLDARLDRRVEIMARGNSVLLIGGAPDDIARAKPWLDALSPLQSVMGAAGAGSAAKVINNAVAHAVYVVLAEALAMARANGIATADFVAMMRGADAGLVRPLTHRIAERVAQRDFAPGMPLDAARKDSVLALEVAQRDGIPLFAIQGAHTAYELACARGLGRDDYAVLAMLWDKWIDRP